MLAKAAPNPITAAGVLVLVVIAALLYLILRNLSALHGTAADRLAEVVAELRAAHEKLAVTVEQLHAAHETLSQVVEQLRIAHERLAEAEGAVASGRIQAVETQLTGLSENVDKLTALIEPVLAAIRG